MLVFMEPITCPHATCGRTWTPRKANPVKCPTCQNPLWQSPRPKRKTISARVEPIKLKPTEVPVADDEQVDRVDFYSQSVGAEPVIILSKPVVHADPLADRKARVESLLAGVI